MEIFYLRILVTIIATIMAIDSAILVYIFPQHASMLFTIEVLILPTIYIISNYYIEETLKKQYEEQISKIEDQAEKLKENYLKEKYLNKSLNRR